MKFPWNKKEVVKSEHEVQLEVLKRETELASARLRAAEVDDTVIAAVKVNALFNKLREGCRDNVEFDRRLKHYAMTSNIDVEYLRQEFSFQDGVKRLESLDLENVTKLEKMLSLKKEAKQLLGWNK